VKTVFTDEKISKQVLAAAKRVSKKRGADHTAPSPVKKPKPSYGEPLTPAALEESLALPSSSVSPSDLSPVVLHTNRAPLVLAFAVSLLKYTKPDQPVSSRLSLAQAVVSANSRSKAVSLGLESGKSAEDEGWGAGQPVVRIMGREIKVMKRWGYEWDVRDEEGATQETVMAEEAEGGKGAMVKEKREPALWGLDLEAAKKKSGSVEGQGGSAQLPIYTAQSARSYLLKSFDSAKEVKGEDEGKTQAKKQSNAAKVAEKEQNAGLLLQALDLLYESWKELEPAELDRRAWGWYVRVRPDVEYGVAGWGGKGDVRLADILALRKTTV
jgi:hypothetical protein